MTPSVLAAMLTIQKNGIGRALSLSVVMSCGFPVGVWSQEPNSNRNLKSMADVGWDHGDGHPDRIFIQELNRQGLHSLSQEVAQRRRFDIVPSSSTANAATAFPEQNARAHWGELWMESVADEQVQAYPSRVDETEIPREALLRIDAFAELESDSPRHAWMIMKAAWCRWFVCRSVVAAYLATPARSALKEVALQEIRFALEQLEQVDTLAGGLAVTNAPNSAGKGAPNANEISALFVESKLLGCDLLVLRAYLYQDQSEERIACGTQMLSLLDEAEKRIGLEFRAQSQVDLARAKAWGFSGQNVKVIEIVQEYFGSQGTRSTGPRNASIEVRQLLAATACEASRNLGDSALANRWLEAGGGWIAAPQLALESLTLDLALLTNGDDAGLQAVLSKKKLIAERFGAYWGQRADSVLVAKRGIAPEGMSAIGEASPVTTASLAILRTEVKQLLAGKQYALAIEKLRQAEGAAKGMDLEPEAIGFAMQIAALQGLQKHFQQSAEEFFRASVEYPKSELAVRAAMNAIAVTQEQFKALQAMSKVSKTNEAQTALQSQLLQMTELRTKVWKHVIELWPHTEQGRSAAVALAGYYISIDAVWEEADLWTGLWELVHRSTHFPSPAEARGSLSNLSPPEYQPFPPDYQQFIADKAMGSFRCIAWLRNQSWLDSNVLAGGSNLESNGSVEDKVVERFDGLKQRLEKLVLHSNELGLAFKDSLALANGYGWEYVPERRHLQRDGGLKGETGSSKERLLLWVDAQVEFMQWLGNQSGSDQDQQQRLQEALTELKQSPRFASAERSHLALMVDRSLVMMELALSAHAGAAESAVAQMQRLEKENAQDPWWGYYAGRIYQSLPSHREKGLQRFVQIGGSMPAGGDGWLECRARSIQILKQMGRNDEALKLSNMVIALHSKLPAMWLNRIRTP